jgi:hypothetical protein
LKSSYHKTWSVVDRHKKIPQIMACIVALMAILRDKESIQQYSLADINSKYLYLPTIYQIVGVFRLLGLGFKDERVTLLGSML